MEIQQELAIDSYVSQKMTYNDFLNLEKNNENKFEYIDGYVYPRASTSTYHNKIKTSLCFDIGLYLRNINSSCELLDELRLMKVMKEDDKTKDCIADLAIVCDTSKLVAGKYKGIPTLIIEIVSPGNSSVDFIKKRNAYLELGIQEYWILDSRIGELEEVVAYKIRPNEKDVIYTRESILESTVFEGLNINLKPIYEALQRFV